MARILIVDDDNLTRTTLDFILSDHGYDVVTADNGITGGLAAAKTRFDLIVTDIIMPEKEGLEFIAELRGSIPGQKILAISGGERLGNRSPLATAMVMGADAVLAKPFTKTELMAMVSRLIKEGMDG